MNRRELIIRARHARKKAYCPYSEYPVGAALLTEKGNLFLGANVEVSGRSTSAHAEMVAVYKAAMAGETPKTLAVSPKNQTGEAICGLCQHTIAEFCDELLILEDTGDNPPEIYHLQDLIGPAYSPSTR